MILDGAEQFNPSVANLLLKTLEEPPSWGQFILLTSSPEQLLPTIRSRTLPVPCRESAVRLLLDAIDAQFDPATAARCAEVAPLVGGRVGDCLRLALLPGYASLREEIVALWDEYEAAHSAEARLAKGLDKLETILQHTQGMNPADFDYDFNLGYGRRFTESDPVLAALRDRLDEATRRRAADARRDP